jgi:hypothetical protein
MLGRAVVLPLFTVLACTKVDDRAPHAKPSEPEPKLLNAQQTPPSEPIALEPLALRCDGAAVAAAFADLDRGALRALAEGGEGPSTRLLARWEVERRLTPTHTASGSIAPASVTTFVRELTTELDHAPPAWWVEQLSSGTRGSDEAAPLGYDVGLRDDADRRGPWVPGPGSTQVRPDMAAVLSTRDGTLFFDMSMGRVALGPLPETTAIEVARARAGSTIYYATFDRGAGGARFPLRAVSSNGSEQWSTEVCGPDRQVLGGLGYLTVEIVVLEPASDPAAQGLKLPSGESTGIAVFTAESHGIALDVFDPKTGTRTLAWSSDLWFASKAPGSGR